MAELTKSPTNNSFKGWPMIIFWAAMIIFAGHACTHMVAAGDTWVAMASGRHFVNHGVDTVEPFSANSHKPGPTDEQLEKFPEWLRPVIKKIHPTGWVNQNWLTHVIFYKFAQTFGKEGEYNYDGLVYWKFIVTFLAVVCTYFIARLLGVSRPASTIAACFAILTARSFIDIRPAVFSNLMVPLYLLVLLLATYKNIRYIWLIVPLIVFWCNVHGGYIYAFMMLVPFVLIHLITSPSKRLFVTIGFKGVCRTVAAGAAAFIAMIVFNPFHLTNLTHTFEISISKHAESWRSVNEWHSVDWFKEKSNPVGEDTTFAVLFVIMLIALCLWIYARTLKPKVETRRRARQNVDPIQGNYEWPKIDLAYIAIAMFTVYMAVRSRRFIPLGALTISPVIAMFFEQAGKMIVAKTQFDRTHKLDLPALPRNAFMLIAGAFTVAVVSFGVVWGAKYKRIYLDPWPNDDVRNSVFMRLTASNVKPFEVMQFIRDNNISGKMFNHWTEGGAVAFGQTPDPKTGKTPLQLFMDGRAQAAYDHDKFILWQIIKSGGPKGAVVQKALNERRKPRPEDVKDIGQWVDARMKEHNVWVILMPAGEFSSAFMVGVQRNTNWRTAFMDDYQMLLISIADPRGKQLLTDILEMKAKYPNEFTRNLAVAKNLLLYQNPDYARRGLHHAKKAFELSNSQAPMQVLIRDAAAGHPELRGEVISYVKQYLDKFAANKEQYAKQAGYVKKLIAAIIAADYLSKQKIPDASRYARIALEYSNERSDIGMRGKW